MTHRAEHALTHLQRTASYLLIWLIWTTYSLDYLIYL